MACSACKAANNGRPMLKQRPFLIETLTAIGLILAPFVLPYLGFAPNTVNRILVWGLFGIGFDILFGFTGLLSFGQSAFYGTGGFVAAYLLTRAGFPHVFSYRLEPAGAGACRLHIGVRGLWTARAVPRLLARAWLWLVFAHVVRSVENQLLVYRVWRKRRHRNGRQAGS